MKCVRLLAGSAVVAALSMTACGSSQSDDQLSRGSDPVAEVAVPDACKGPFPLAYAQVDDDDVALMPDDWPDPPADSTLCTADGNVDGTRETAGYASASDSDEVLAEYEAALKGTYDVKRVKDGSGAEVLEGENDEIAFQIKPSSDRFTIAFTLTRK
jgi:hypothetical protein